MKPTIRICFYAAALTFVGQFAYSFAIESSKQINSNKEGFETIGGLKFRTVEENSKKLYVFDDAVVGDKATATRWVNLHKPPLGERLTGNDDRYLSYQQAFNIRYCIDGTFSTLAGGKTNAFDQVEGTFAAAAVSWILASSGINISYDRKRNSINCTADNNSTNGGEVEFVVTSGAGILAPNTVARSFFPVNSAETRRLLINPDFLVGGRTPFTNGQWSKTFRHEIGHILGFSHEHYRWNPLGNGDCNAGLRFPSLSSEDPWSIMAYSQCGGRGSADQELSASDIQGTRKIYPNNNKIKFTTAQVGTLNQQLILADIDLRIIFDPSYYYEINHDVTTLVNRNQGLVSVALRHWLQDGITEGRTASRVFSAPYFLRNYGNDSKVTNYCNQKGGSNLYQCVVSYFADNFLTDTRQAAPTFCIKGYLVDELKDIFKKNLKGGYDHYFKYGQVEGRRIDLNSCDRSNQ